MTFLQQTLGRRYKWWYIMKFNFHSSSSNLRGLVIGILSEVIKTSAIVYVWYFKGSDTNVFLYLLLGMVFKSMGEYYFYNRFAEYIASGSITNRLILPTSPMKVYGIGGIGYRVSPNFIESIAPISALIFFQFYSKIDLIQNIDFLKFLTIAIFFVPISYCINYFIGYLVGSIAFFLPDKREITGFSNTATNLIFVLRGLIIPLDKIPFSTVFISLPTAYALHHPMQIYLGKYDSLQILQTFAGGIAWCFILWILARLVFKAGLKKNEAVGL